MSIVAQRKKFNGLSGKYIFHSMVHNKPAFIREDEAPGVKGKNHYLVWHSERWYIQSDELFLKGKCGGYFCIYTSGKYFHNCFLSV